MLRPDVIVCVYAANFTVAQHTVLYTCIESVARNHNYKRMRFTSTSILSRTARFEIVIRTHHTFRIVNVVR